jgi:ribosomal RNA-processing protein 12
VQAAGGTVDGNAEAEYCKYLDLALSIASGMSDGAMEPLLKATAIGINIPMPAAQKKAYKTLTYIINQRSAVLRSHVTDICAIFTKSKPVQAPAKRHRLACIAPVISLLYSSEESVVFDLSELNLPEMEAGKSAAHLIVSSLITEIVLCTKEVNAKTRTLAYEVLVQIAHAMHESRPPDRSMETGVCAFAPCAC